MDTDLSRFGLKTIDEVRIVMKIISRNPNLNCTGVFTHFSTSEDMKNKSYFHQQLASFYEFLDVIPNRTDKIIHCENYGATLYHTEKPFFDMIRLEKALMDPPNEELKHLLPVELQKYTLALLYLKYCEAIRCQ
ncbi:unnamed protein product [Rotaria sordida]|uniref:Alanine racemase N-terminal domain-containing protein n=1 Tax=Rotaria sordida TaxID=392033 RepID=A0A813X7L5_9BILA|nr:unnamed protein product [Rotaria sordida]CAF0951236.1 unnamed protein product [Rotaria sordida]CAF3886051.1 unnamed protein product [Rotaria sordida]